MDIFKVNIAKTVIVLKKGEYVIDFDENYDYWLSFLMLLTSNQHV